MKLGISSILGNPSNEKVWSSAPFHLGQALSKLDIDVVPIDTSCLTKRRKYFYAGRSILSTIPAKAVGWSTLARKYRGDYLAETATSLGVEHHLCTGTLDAPVGTGLDYSIWIDNTWDLLCDGRMALDWARGDARMAVDALEREALQGARFVATFGEHVRQNVIRHYGVSPDRVHAIGCGSGSLPPFSGHKDYSSGHLLFVAKHQFRDKGGFLAIEAFRHVQKERPSTKMIIVGSKEAVDAAQGIPGIEVHGFVAREVLNRFFHDASILLQPMLADPWGQVYLEGMKARAVLVALEVGSVPEITNGGALGVMVSDPDPLALAHAVLGVLEQPRVDLDRMTSAAQAKVLREYEWDVVARRYLGAMEFHLFSGGSIRKYAA